MRCPQCGNEEKFQHFYLAWRLDRVTYKGDQAISVHDEESDVDSTKEIICPKCELCALPEVFEPYDPEWREVKQGEDGRYYIENEEIGYWHTMVEGNLYLSDKDADIYMRLQKIHQTSSVGDLAEMLVHNHPAVRNAAMDKMNWLLFFTRYNNIKRR